MLFRLRFMTAGESHGPGVLAFLEGVPAGVAIDVDAVNRQLSRRQGGYGRGKRMEIESDRVEILAGLKRGVTLGSPLGLLVRNADHRIDRYRSLSCPRPGHADLTGALKVGTRDCGDIMERASARETAGRVAAGAVAAQVLREAGIRVFAHVVRIGPVVFQAPEDADPALRERSPFYGLDPEADALAAAHVDAMREAGDSVGGAFQIRAAGVPPGLGSHIQWDRRLDARLAGALMSIQGMKAVEIGLGTAAGSTPGSAVQDPILRDETGFLRAGNNAGGIEGGISNGEPVLARVTMKPIPTLRKPLPSVDLTTGAPRDAVYERSDVCSVPAASVVGEAMAALVLLDALLEKTGGDSLEEVLRNLKAFLEVASGLLPPDPSGS